MAPEYAITTQNGELVNIKYFKNHGVWISYNKIYIKEIKELNIGSTV